MIEAGFPDSGSGVIEGNTITDNNTRGRKFIAGVSIVGGISLSVGERPINNTVDIEIRDNLVRDSGRGIAVLAGLGDTADNTVTTVIERNEVVTNMKGEGDIAGIDLAEHAFEQHRSSL